MDKYIYKFYDFMSMNEKCGKAKDVWRQDSDIYKIYSLSFHEIERNKHYSETPMHQR